MIFLFFQIVVAFHFFLLLLKSVRKEKSAVRADDEMRKEMNIKSDLKDN